MGEAAQQFDQADLHFRHPPDLPNIEVAQPKPAKEVYAEKVIAIQNKLALLPAKETANLTPLISRIREQGKIDLQRAIGYADVLLGALEAEPPSGRKNPIELPVPGTNTSEFIGEPDFQSIVTEENVAAQDDAEVAYEHRLFDIEEKLKALPAVEKYELAPVLNRLTQYRKNDIKHASEYADLILNVLNIEPTEQTGQNEIVPPASPEITASSNELTLEDLEKGEDLLAHYNEQMHAIQEKLNTLSQEERVKFIPALNQIAKYSQNDIQRASNYADIILNGLEVDDRNAKNPDTKKFDKSIAKDKKRFDAQDTTKSVKDNDDWRWQQKIKDAKAAEALREKIKAQQENDENAEFENLKRAAEVKVAKEQIEKSAQLSPVSRENSMNQFTPVVEPAPLPQKSGFFSGVAKGFKKLFGRN